jgi:hypothetical protein
MIPTSQNRAINHTGLRKRPQMEQLVDYLQNGQERVKFPNREAKFIRNHPFMTQLDFFDMQEDMKNAWEEKEREHEAEQISEETQETAAEVRTTTTRYSDSTSSQTQYFFIGSRPDEDMDDPPEQYKRERDDLDSDAARKRANTTQTVTRLLRTNYESAPFIHRLVVKGQAEPEPMKEEPVFIKREKFERSRSPNVKKEPVVKQEPTVKQEPNVKKEKVERSRSPNVKKEVKTEVKKEVKPNAPMINQEPTSAPAEAKRVIGTGSASSTAAPKLQQSRGRWWAGRDNPPPLPEPPQSGKKRAASAADDLEITGTGGINHTKDMKFWQDSSAREIRTQFALRGISKNDYAFKTKEQLLYIIKARIQDGNW